MRIPGTIALTTLLAGAIGCEARTDRREVASATGGDTTSAPSADHAGEHNQTLVRVVHAVPGGPAVDLTADDRPIFTAVEFKTVTPYEAVEENRPHFKLTTAGDTATKPLAENAELVMDGQYYTVIAMADDDGKAIQLQPMRDDLTPANPAKARIRIVNAAEGSTDVDVRLESATETLFDDVGFEEEAGFKEIDPATVTLVVTGEESDRILLRIPALDLKAGQSVTLVLTHPSKSSTKLEAIRVVDELKALSGT
jgi:hypothetical protein